MDAISIVLLGILVLLVINAIALFVLFTRSSKGNGGEGLSFIQQQISDLSKTLDAKVSESSRAMQENAHRQFSESSKLIKEITQEVTSVKEIGRQTQGFAEQLKSLQDILKNPKQRGVLGEYYLETVLKNVLPPGMYQTQYPFTNGEVVDAVVFVNDKVVPIDSKFSLENYNRLVQASPDERTAFEKIFVNDLKLRITETAKYIRPEERTMDFAFMFIPSEGIYYDLLTNQVGAGEDDNLIQRAASKYKVIIVSPTSFLAYLQTVMQGLKALSIEKKAEEIQKRVGELGKHLQTYEGYMQKLGNTLGTTVNHYNAAYKELGKIDKDVLRIAGEGVGVSVETLDGVEKND
ncbi:DNA recombination protein RmuC [Candidatus Kaiserbacteria bacterium CG10_big_fil_rev_8_21_14_0_10_45_20]|uniref:DNA recombination protein RmuC n=1 Tax=Candidatus Kaiserbacteria bacterium CG10_big_fil_rev_8_21_14_0_10_45_20 TaxID=1974607 RepID=A0A2H0UGE9_9BACT|nr:MAG: DNA recombination protein RmuC [Candidatus Kaiserbacteria bacterium CG10_big_fil_rev_8_21_14_0_10_45_20]